MIKSVSGDLLVNSINAQAIAHGCNARGLMGAGIAAQIKAKFPRVYDDYRAACMTGLLRPGDVHFAGYSNPKVFNLITQHDPGRFATTVAIETAIEKMYKIADANGITTIAINKVGCGIGGLQWGDVYASISSIKWGGILYIYTEWMPRQ